MTWYRTHLLAFLVLLASACATPCPPKAQISTERYKQCQEFMHRLDEKVHATGMKDSSTSSVPCFPYLRSNRFLSALTKTLKKDAEREYWLQWMRELDLTARKKEIRNLPDEEILSLAVIQGEKLDRQKLYNRVESCSRKLVDDDQAREDFYEILDSFVRVPDQYSFTMRAAGLYPVTSIPVTIATARAREKFRSWFNTNPEDIPVDGQLMTFAPAEQVCLRETELEKMLGESTRNALRVPRLDAAREKKLVAHFAPIFVQDISAPYDRFGRVIWGMDRLEIETENPTVYWYVSNAFFKGEPVLQINYVIWYSERAGRNSPWMERGYLDGLTVRVSLDSRGGPFMVDLMNNCGCYHLFSPQKTRVERVVSKRFALDPFMPQWLPEILPGKRLGIRLNSGWHQVLRLFALGLPRKAISYELIPYEVLETLPRNDGRTESVFDAKGIAKGSSRIEPLFLFPMGIASVGSMRQRGNHPISLTGRVHFDDPYLFDRSFVFK